MTDEAKTGGRDGINLSNLPVKWGDAQQFHAEPHDQSDSDEDGGTYGVEPRVHLLTMTERPLQVVAAMAAMYEGKVVRDLDDLSRMDVEVAWKNVLATHLDTPLEAVEFHFLIEGVDRAFTHQLVRQRVGAAFAQESLRFAVVEDLLGSSTLPPSLAGTVPEAVAGISDSAAKPQAWRGIWDQALQEVDRAYRTLVDSGMPAEEARGLLPHCTATRIHYHTNLRALSKMAGDRLCTQAQFVWRRVVAMMIGAIRNQWQTLDQLGNYQNALKVKWQYEAIADSSLFRPVCFQLGHCPMKASFDRACTIRERVDHFAKRGVPSDKWGERYEEAGYHSDPLPWGSVTDGQPDGKSIIPAINPAEWLANPGAARK